MTDEGDDSGGGGGGEAEGTSLRTRVEVLQRVWCRLPKVSALREMLRPQAPAEEPDPAEVPELPAAAEPPPDLEERLVSEARSKMVDVSQLTAGILSGLLLLLLQALPNPFPDPRSYVAGWSWPQWLTAAVSVLFVAALIRIAIIVFAYHDPLPPSLLRGSATVLVALLALTTLPRWLAPGDAACGAAEIAVDDLLQSQVQGALGKYQSQVAAHGREADGRPVRCAGSLQVVGIGLDQDLRERLGTSGTPLAAVITSNPAILRGLHGDWHNLEVGAVATSGWYTIGLDTAMVYLNGSEHAPYAQIELSQLSQLYARAGRSADPVALEVFTALGGKPTSRLDVRPEEIEATRPCPADVVLPGSWTPSCVAGGVHRVSIVDGEGNFIGAPVMAIPLRIERANPVLAQTGPTDSAHLATTDFLSWLEDDHEQLGLKNLLDPVPAILARATPVQAIPSRRGVQVNVVLDASLSMGRVSDDQDFGGTAAWPPAVAGLSAWADHTPLEPGDQLAVVVAQKGRAGVRPRTVQAPAGAVAGLRIPSAAPQGQTGLSAALDQVRRIEAQPGHVHQDHLTVLLTDGVNVFTEKPVADLSDVVVVVIGNPKGCLAVPSAARKRCVSTDTDATDVVDQLATLTTRTGDS